MNILFIHRSFPAQYKYLAFELAKDPNNNVVFVTNNTSTDTYGGIKKVVYKLKREVPQNCHRYLRFYEESIIHGQAVAEVLIQLQSRGFKPDIIYGHSWGSSMFVKDIFPNVPYVAYLEWYYNSKGTDEDFGGKVLDVDRKAAIRCKNSHILEDLASCDYGITPTEWQKSQFPKEFLHKIKVLHEGIDTDICTPNRDVEFKVPNTDIILTRRDEVLTYATRGMEEYRGFPEFMKAASILQKIRPNLHVVVGGEDRVCYGKPLKDDTWKQKMLRELDFDMTRLHFTGLMNYCDYVKLLQVSSVHIYLTYPFVLSWSLLEAMSSCCCVVGSDTAPVREIIENGYNGILTDFYNIDSMVEKANDIFEHPEKYVHMREKARETIVKKYDMRNLMKEQLSFLNFCIK